MSKPKAAAAQNIAPVERSPGAEDAAPAAAPSFHDFRDVGNPLEKV